MIENMTLRVAHAIAEARSDSDWSRHISAALAAIAAMREPTDEMLDAAMPGCVDWGYLPEEWRAMIDCAVQEGLRVLHGGQGRPHESGQRLE